MRRVSDLASFFAKKITAVSAAKDFKKFAALESERGGIYGNCSGTIMLVLIPTVLFLHFSLVNIGEKTPGRTVPFQVGEKLMYRGTWGIIPAGEITLEVLPKETIKGVECYHFVMMTKTSPVVDLVYKVRERQDSYVDAVLIRSVLYRKKTESQHPRDETVEFNWEKKEMIYTNFGETKPPKQIIPGTLDPLGIFYALRLRTLKENTVIHVPVTDGNNVSMEIKATIGKKEVLEIEGKKYDVVQIIPHMEMLDQLEKDKVIKKSDDPKLKIWVTADEKKVPIRIRSKVGIMTFDFDLMTGPS